MPLGPWNIAPRNNMDLTLRFSSVGDGSGTIGKNYEFLGPNGFRLWASGDRTATYTDPETGEKVRPMHGNRRSDLFPGPSYSTWNANPYKNEFAANFARKFLSKVQATDTAPFTDFWQDSTKPNIEGGGGGRRMFFDPRLRNYINGNQYARLGWDQIHSWSDWSATHRPMFHLRRSAGGTGAGWSPPVVGNGYEFNRVGEDQHWGQNEHWGDADPAWTGQQDNNYDGYSWEDRGHRIPHYNQSGVIIGAPISLCCQFMNYATYSMAWASRNWDSSTHHCDQPRSIACSLWCCMSFWLAGYNDLPDELVNAVCYGKRPRDFLSKHAAWCLSNRYTGGVDSGKNGCYLDTGACSTDIVKNCPCDSMFDADGWFYVGGNRWGQKAAIPSSQYTWQAGMVLWACREMVLFDEYIEEVEGAPALGPGIRQGLMEKFNYETGLYSLFQLPATDAEGRATNDEGAFTYYGMTWNRDFADFERHEFYDIETAGHDLEGLTALDTEWIACGKSPPVEAAQHIIPHPRTAGVYNYVGNNEDLGGHQNGLLFAAALAYLKGQDSTEVKKFEASQTWRNNTTFDSSIYKYVECILALREQSSTIFKAWPSVSIGVTPNYVRQWQSGGTKRRWSAGNVSLIPQYRTQQKITKDAGSIALVPHYGYRHLDRGARNTKHTWDSGLVYVHQPLHRGDEDPFLSSFITMRKLWDSGSVTLTADLIQRHIDRQARTYHETWNADSLTMIVRWTRKVFPGLGGGPNIVYRVWDGGTVAIGQVHYLKRFEGGGINTFSHTWDLGDLPIVANYSGVFENAGPIETFRTWNAGSVRLLPQYIRTVEGGNGGTVFKSWDVGALTLEPQWVHRHDEHTILRSWNAGTFSVTGKSYAKGVDRTAIWDAGDVVLASTYSNQDATAKSWFAFVRIVEDAWNRAREKTWTADPVVSFVGSYSKETTSLFREIENPIMLNGFRGTIGRKELVFDYQLGTDQSFELQLYEQSEDAYANLSAVSTGLVSIRDYPGGTERLSTYTTFVNQSTGRIKFSVRADDFDVEIPEGRDSVTLSFSMKFVVHDYDTNSDVFWELVDGAQNRAFDFRVHWSA